MMEQVALSVVEPNDPTLDEIPDLTIEPTLVATGRRRYGAAGAIMGAGFLGIEKALGLRKVKEEAPIVIAAATEPVDIDSDGIDVAVDEETSVNAPPQPRSKPHLKQVRRRR